MRYHDDYCGVVLSSGCGTGLGVKTRATMGDGKSALLKVESLSRYLQPVPWLIALWRLAFAFLLEFRHIDGESRFMVCPGSRAPGNGGTLAAAATVALQMLMSVETHPTVHRL
jgi:hypothetical protein